MHYYYEYVTSLTKYALIAFSVQSTVLGTRNIVMNKTKSLYSYTKYLADF